VVVANFGREEFVCQNILCFEDRVCDEWTFIHPLSHELTWKHFLP